jgi:protein-tyrosine phosphatase
MVDIHSHILPDQDDGARTFEEALSMVLLAAAAGTTDMVASPHANSRFAFDPTVVERKIAELQRAAGDAVRIHYGCDFHLTPENIEDAIAAPGKYSIDHKGYILVELADNMVPRTMASILTRMLAAGLRPIVTHPERNPLLHKKLSELEFWVRQGCLIQVTAQSFVGKFGRSAKSASDELMRRGLVHFLASDAHDGTHRPPLLDEAWRYTARHYGEETARLLLEDNPRAALTGADLPFAEMEVKKRKWFSRFHSKT